MELLFLGLLLGLMMLSLGAGFPVAFALPGCAIVTIGIAAAAGALVMGDARAFFASGGAVEWLTAGVTNFRGVYWDAGRDTLIAIPLFVFMGIMLQRSKIAEDLLVTMARLFGRLPGGLGISVVIVGALLAATTGIVGATVVAMGLISLPAMMRNGYAQPLATGTILASGTLGQIIPPSIVLIILADQLSSAVDKAQQMRVEAYREATGAFAMPPQLGVVPTSAGDMFMGALFPGLVLVGMYVLFVLGYALLRPQSAPAVPTEGTMDAAFWRAVVLATVPPLVLILLVLGSIITGVATVTQAGAVGAAGATAMAGYKLHAGRSRFVPVLLVLAALAALWALSAQFNLNIRQLETSGAHGPVALAAAASAVLLGALGWSAWRTWRVGDTLRAVMVETAKTSALVFIILLGAAMLISAFRAFGGEDLVRTFLTGLPGGFWGQFAIVMLVIFVLGFFLDFIEIAIVVVPIVAPILLMNPEANVTAVWLGVMIGLNIQTSFLTPPFGFALFYLRGVADRTVRTLNMYKGVIPFIALQLAAILIVGVNPALVNYLPARISLLSENAPPPRNPRLQHCVEEILLDRVPAQRAEVMERIGALRATETAMLPRDRARDLAGALDGYAQSFDRLSDLRAAQEAVARATPDYRPLHRTVSDLQRDVARLEGRIERIERQLLLLRDTATDAAAQRAALEERRAESAGAHRRDRGPHAAGLGGAPRRLPRAQAGRGGRPPCLSARRRPVLHHAARADRRDRRGAGLCRCGAAGGTPRRPRRAGRPRSAGRGNSRAGARAARPARRGGRDRRAARSAPRAHGPPRRSGPRRRSRREAVATARRAAAWRADAAADLAPRLVALEELTRTTLGLREQPRLQRADALRVAGCLSEHRDVSLNF